MPKGYPLEQRDRATRMAVDRLEEYGSAWAVARATRQSPAGGL